MDRDTARQEIRESWKRLFPADRKNKGIICPLCGNGKGSSGDGITENPRKPGQLTCWKCGFTGDVIDLYQKRDGSDYNTALKAAAADLGITIDPYNAPDADRIDSIVTGWKQHKAAQSAQEDALASWIAEQEKAELDGEPGEINIIHRAWEYWHAGQPIPQLLESWIKTNCEAQSLQEVFEKNLLIRDGEITTFGEYAIKNATERDSDDFNSIDDKKPAETEKAAENATEAPIEGEIANYTAYYRACMGKLKDPAAVSYLQARGISIDTALSLYLGYDSAWISPAAIKTLQAKGSNWRPAPTARIIIPVSKNHYIARAIDPAITAFEKPNETGGGSAGIFNARILREDHEAIFVVEGAFDALSIIEAGAAAVAINSTSNVNLFVKKLEETKPGATFILCLDNDDAGKKAAANLKQELTRLNISYVVADISCNYKDPNEALTNARAEFEKAVKDAQAQTAARPDNVSQYIDNLMLPEIERLKAAADRKTGFARLDEKSGGLYPGLYVIAATSSLGKTTFSLQIADNLAAAGHDVLFFSMEQSRLELVSKSFARILAQENNDKISSLSLRKGYYPDKLQEAAGIYKARVADHLSIIEGNFNCNISFIGDYIRRYIRRNNCSPIVFIDYLQILQPADDARTMSVKETVDNTVTELKRISREHDLTVFVVSSVNRANYLAPIDFEALKESGGIEYTADVIWGLQLQCLNDPLFESANKIKEKRQKIREEKAADPRRIELLCLKNRYGIANFSCGFDYYPARDLFVQGSKDGFYPYYEEEEFNSAEKQAGNGEKITASF